MTGTEVARRVKSRVGDAGGTFVTDTDVLDLINDAQLLINREAKVVTAHTAATNTVANQSTYTLPTDFLSARSLFFNGEKYITFVPAQEFRKNYPPVGNIAGTPEFFSIEGYELVFYPTPDKIYSYDLHYVKIPAAVAAIGSSLTLPTFLHTHVVDFVYALMKERDEDYEASMLIRTSAMADLAMSVSLATSGSEESYPVVRDVSDYFYE